MQMRSRDLIENSKWRRSPSPTPYSSTLEGSSKYHVISIAKKHFLSFRIRPYLSINYQILIFVTQFRDENGRHKRSAHEID
jgi:hypothetical protein